MKSRIFNRLWRFLVSSKERQKKQHQDAFQQARKMSHDEVNQLKSITSAHLEKGKATDFHAYKQEVDCLKSSLKNQKES